MGASIRKRLRASACGRSVGDLCIQSSWKSPRASPRAARRAVPPISSASARPRPAAPPGAISAVPTSPTASPRAAPTRSSTCGPAERRNVAIVSAYNDMLSAHQPFERYPAILKKAVLQAGGVAQFAGGVPAMCDGITQGRAGMELSLFSRDVVAMSTAVALSHDMFDGALMLGVCDKIVPGLLIGALTLRPPADGLRPRRADAVRPARTPRRAASASCTRTGEVGRDELLDAELASYHSPGTCTFYGTANSNQLVVEAMGLHLPGASLREPRHAAAARADRGGRRGA